jgi:hypothetical protein
MWSGSSEKVGHSIVTSLSHLTNESFIDLIQMRGNSPIAAPTGPVPAAKGELVRGEIQKFPNGAEGRGGGARARSHGDVP